MQATKAREPRQQDSASHQHESKSRTQASLDTRYGRIGISAVAAAVNQKGESKPVIKSSHAQRYERE